MDGRRPFGFRYKNYVFLGDEVFPAQCDHRQSTDPHQGIVHVVDVSDILNPRKVAEYDVPEEGAHNMWVENDVMLIGYYGGGARAVDVSVSCAEIFTSRDVRWLAYGPATKVPAEHSVCMGRSRTTG